MKRKHIKMTRKHRRHFKNSARKTRIANTMPTIKRGGYRA